MREVNLQSPQLPLKPILHKIVHRDLIHYVSSECTAWIGSCRGVRQRNTCLSLMNALLSGLGLWMPGMRLYC